MRSRIRVLAFHSSAQNPAPICGVSPIRPTNLLVRPPVEVRTAIQPSWSSATAPTVPVGYGEDVGVKCGCWRTSSGEGSSGSPRPRWCSLHLSSVKKYEGSTRISPSDSPMDSAVAPDRKTWGATDGWRYSARTNRDGFLVRVRRARLIPRRDFGISGWDRGGFDSMIDASSSFYKTTISSILRCSVNLLSRQH